MASATPDDLWKGMDWWKDLAPSQHELALVLGAIAFVGLLAVLWAVFIRKRENNGSKRYIYSSARGARNNGSEADGAGRKSRRRRRRRHRRNPTLAETGGLPPIRGEILPGDPP